MKRAREHHVGAIHVLPEQWEAPGRQGQVWASHWLWLPKCLAWSRVCVCVCVGGARKTWYHISCLWFCCQLSVFEMLCLVGVGQFKAVYQFSGVSDFRRTCLRALFLYSTNITLLFLSTPLACLVLTTYLWQLLFCHSLSVKLRAKMKRNKLFLFPPCRTSYSQWHQQKPNISSVSTSPLPSSRSPCNPLPSSWLCAYLSDRMFWYAPVHFMSLYSYQTCYSMCWLHSSSYFAVGKVSHKQQYPFYNIVKSKHANLILLLWQQIYRE